MKKFVVCQPQYLSSAIINNAYMEDLAKEKGELVVDTDKALAQHENLRSLLQKYGSEVLEIPPAVGCQDQTYTANIGASVNGAVVLANFKAPGRKEEEEPARKFFTNLGYEVVQSPYHFEGEADLKKFREKTFFSGYGIRTGRRAHKWMEKTFGITIIPLKIKSAYHYHLDCSVFVIDEENILVTPEGLTKDSLKTLEHYANIVYTPKEFECDGITNAVKLPQQKVVITHFSESRKDSELKRIDWMSSALANFNYELKTVNIDEFEKSGALLSCCVMDITDTPIKG